jgi:5-oxoprolinase (ATP-hydrolysing) subunit A
MRVDLNADVGEGCDDQALLPFLTSVNVACGGHAGDERSMAGTVEAALRLGVSIGAHPSYPDRERFGRHDVDLPGRELGRSIRVQVHALERVAERAGTRVAHVKPHGALYNRAARDRQVAETVARAVAEVDSGLRLVALAGSALIDAARESGLVAVAEGFADRRYAADGSLAPRSLPGAVIHDAAEAAEQALDIVGRHEIVALGGAKIAVRVDTLCVHGDTPGAAAIARAVHERLRQAGIEIARF